MNYIIISSKIVKKKPITRMIINLEFLFHNNFSYLT